MRKIFLLPAVLCLTFVNSAFAKENTGKRFDFANTALLKKQWMKKGKQFGVPMSTFVIVPAAGADDKRALSVKTDSSSGILVTRIPEELWSQYPVLRWRWRILKKAAITGKEPDDQAAVLYFGDGTMLKQQLLAYRWEHAFKIGTQSLIKYSMGSTLVSRICVRNKEAELSKWYQEERNVVEDFKKAFGRMPDGDCALTIGANSQYSKSKTVVEIDFIEFRKAETKAALPCGELAVTAERKIEK